MFFKFMKKNLDGSKQRDNNAFRLNKLLMLANQIIDTNPRAIKEFVNLLGRKYQSEYMVKAVSAASEHKVENLEPKIVWFSEFIPLNYNGETLDSIKKKIDIDATLKLSHDLVLPWPWNMERVVRNLSCIGKDKICGEWVQDDNHKVELWLPFGIAWVHGGNHSIASGILQGEGTVKPKKIYDISAVFDLVKFDGDCFIRIDTGEKISSKVSDFEFAAIFEVGRLIHKRGLPL